MDPNNNNNQGFDPTGNPVVPPQEPTSQPNPPMVSNPAPVEPQNPTSSNVQPLPLSPFEPANPTTPLSDPSPLPTPPSTPQPPLPDQPAPQTVQTPQTSGFEPSPLGAILPTIPLVSSFEPSGSLSPTPGMDFPPSQPLSTSLPAQGLPPTGLPSVATPTWLPQPEEQSKLGLGVEPLPPAPTFSPSTEAENTPTDLSHLMGEPAPQTEEVGPNQPETLVVPPPSEANQVVTGGNGGFPKWVAIVGALVLLLLVTGASAYFILGIGKPASSSVPIEQPPLTNPPRTVVPTLQPTNQSTPSAGFGNLEGISPTPSQSGTSSAIDLLRQRQTR